MRMRPVSVLVVPSLDTHTRRHFLAQGQPPGKRNRVAGGRTAGDFQLYSAAMGSTHPDAGTPGGPLLAAKR